MTRSVHLVISLLFFTPAVLRCFFEYIDGRSNKGSLFLSLSTHNEAHDIHPESMISTNLSLEKHKKHFCSVYTSSGSAHLLVRRRCIV